MVRSGRFSWGGVHNTISLYFALLMLKLGRGVVYEKVLQENASKREREVRV